MSRALCALALAALLCCAVPAYADQVTVNGSITQSTADGTGPAVNNPSLNNVVDGDAYTVELSFTGSISVPGTYCTAGAGCSGTFNNLSGWSLVFNDAAAPASETAFSSVSLTITENSGVDEFNWLGCLPTGTSCDQGNQLDLIFTIPSAGLNNQNVAAQLDPLHSSSFELMEDDSLTNIFGSVTSYSYTVTPEPGTFTLFASGLAGLAALRRRFRRS